MTRRTTTTAESGWSAGVARVPGARDSAGRRAAARLFGHPSRIIGLDVARGAALLGLATVVWFGSTDAGGEIATRVATVSRFGAGEVVAPAEGVASALTIASTVVALAFVLIAGVATALSTGGATPASGVERLRCRMRLTVRAIVLLGIGGVAAFTDAGFAGLVATVGALTLLSLAVLGWRAGTLFLTATLWTIVVPVLDTVFVPVVENSGTLIAPPLEWLLSGPFPPVPLGGVLLAGMAVGRLDPTRAGHRWIVFAGAIGCAVLAFAGGLAVSARLGDSLPAALSAAPGAMTPLALLGAGGVALALLALALLAGRPLRWLLAPFSAAGSLALTLWIGALGVVGALWVLGRPAAEEGVESVFADLARSYPVTGLLAGVPDPLRSSAVAAASVVLVAFACVVWRLFLGDGPVERLVRTIGRAATRVPEVPASVTAPPVDSAFDALIGGRDATTEASDATGAATSGPAETHPAPETHPIRRQTIGPVDPVTAATQWTPGQALGRLPY